MIRAMITLSDQEAKKIIAVNLKRLRGELSYSEIARRAGTYPMAIQRIEKGDSMPGVGLLTRIADALNCKVDDFLKPTEKKTQQTA